jgi:hypothetical protein
MVGASTQNLNIEVFSVTHDSDGNPVIWNVIGKGTIGYTSVSWIKSEVVGSATISNPSTIPNGAHIAVVLSMPTINAINYYRWYADSTQYSIGQWSTNWNSTSWTNWTNILWLWGEYIAEVVCRANTNILTTPIPVYKNVTWLNQLTNSTAFIQIYTLTIANESMRNLIFSFHINQTNSALPYVEFRRNWTAEWNYNNTWDYIHTGSYNIGDIITIWLRSTSSSYSVTFYNLLIYSTKLKDKQYKISKKLLYPITTWVIGEYRDFITFGKFNSKLKSWRYINSTNILKTNTDKSGSINSSMSVPGISYTCLFPWSLTISCHYTTNGGSVSVRFLQNWVNVNTATNTTPEADNIATYTFNWLERWDVISIEWRTGAAAYINVSLTQQKVMWDITFDELSSWDMFWLYLEHIFTEKYDIRLW